MIQPITITAIRTGMLSLGMTRIEQETTPLGLRLAARVGAGRWSIEIVDLGDGYIILVLAGDETVKTSADDPGRLPGAVLAGIEEMQRRMR